MTLDELRKHVIECRTLEEMRTVWGTLKGMGEDMYKNTFRYPRAENFDRGGGRWMSSNNKPTMSYSTFMTEFGHKQDIDRDFLRKQVVGGFNSLAEMKEAWELLKDAGESMARERFDYMDVDRLDATPYSTFWGITEQSATMSLQELKNFINCPSAPIEEATKSDESMCNCKSLIHGHSLGCHYFKER
jgi:hypothetical protein